ncbi:MAG: tyrosine-type recombinase/integrase [Xanthobacteraceae bacterium]
MTLKSLSLEHAKPRDRPYKLSDGEGLHLLVQTTGAKLWRFRYRFGGKENMIGFGSFPEVSLASARQKRDEARKVLAEGKDPSQQKKLDRLSAQIAAANTWEAIVEEFLAHEVEKGLAEVTREKNRWMLCDLASALSKRPISEITSAEILQVLKHVEKTRRETARKLRGKIGGVFRFAISNLKCQTDPTYALRGSLLPPVVKHRAAITEERELGALMLAIDEYTGWVTVRAALLFTALTMARPIEVRMMRRSEVNWVSGLWSVPQARMKMRRPHVVPLSRQALEVLRSVWELSEGDGLVFPSIRSKLKPLSENATNSALRRMGYSKEEVCTHGFRASAQTILLERGFDEDVIEVALAHEEEDETKRAYKRVKYIEQRKALMQSWADLLDQFRSESKIKLLVV